MTEKDSNQDIEACLAMLEELDRFIPPETRATYERLKREGIEEGEARRLLACVISAEISEVAKNNEHVNLKRFAMRLQTLPETPWMTDRVEH